jgi:hypothetical protein
MEGMSVEWCLARDERAKVGFYLPIGAIAPPYARGLGGGTVAMLSSIDPHGWTD